MTICSKVHFMAAPIVMATCLIAIPASQAAIAAKPSPWATQKIDPNVPTQWKTYTAKQGKFSVLMPGETKLVHNAAIWGVVGQDVATPSTFYSAMYMDFDTIPAEITEQLAQDALDNGVRNFLVQGKRQLVARSRFTLDGNPGQEIRYRLTAKPGFTGRSRIFLVGKRLYMLMVETDRETALTNKMDEFLRSFKLL
jgi:hypothetical protein